MTPNLDFNILNVKNLKMVYDIVTMAD